MKLITMLGNGSESKKSQFKKNIVGGRIFNRRLQELNKRYYRKRMIINIWKSILLLKYKRSWEEDEGPS